jgi:hypothetical protein
MATGQFLFPGLRAEWALREAIRYRLAQKCEETIGVFYSEARKPGEF